MSATRVQLFGSMALAWPSAMAADWRRGASEVVATSSERGRMVLVGDLPQFASWRAAFFPSGSQQSVLGTYSLPALLAGAVRADIVVAAANVLTLPLYSALGWHVVPLWVACHLDLRRPFADLARSRGVREDLRALRKLGYRYERIEGESEIREFYDQMLVPTVRTRHAERAFVSSWEGIRKACREGWLIGLFRGEEWIAGQIVAREGPRALRLANVAWRGGETCHLKARVVPALTYETIRRAQEEGLDSLDLGSNQPFANDGPLNWKLRFAVTLVPPRLEVVAGAIEGMRSYLAVRIDTRSAGAHALLTRNPLLAARPGGRLGGLGPRTQVRSEFRHQIEAGLSWHDPFAGASPAGLRA